MPFEIKVDKDFAGPTFCELEPVLDELPGPVEVKWAGTRQDILLYERNADRKIRDIDKKGDVKKVKAPRFIKR